MIKLYHLQLLDKKDGGVSKLPAVFAIKGVSVNTYITILGAFVIGAEPFYILATNFSGIEKDFLKILAVAASLMLLAMAIFQFSIKGSMHVDEKGVTFEQNSFWGQKKWFESISSYQGIKTKRVSKNIGGDTRYLVSQIWLHHKKRNRRVKLMEFSDHSRSEEYAAKYCNMFSLNKV